MNRKVPVPRQRVESTTHCHLDKTNMDKNINAPNFLCGTGGIISEKFHENFKILHRPIFINVSIIIIYRYYSLH